MFNSRMYAIAALVMAFTASTAFANDKTQPGKPGQQPVKQIDWEDLKERCMYPDKTDVQRAPQNIRVYCSDSYTSWVAMAPGEVPLPGNRTITTEIFADKFHVGEQTSEVPVLTKAGSCPNFKQVEYSITKEIPISCGEILGWKGTLPELCMTQLDKTKAANPKLVQQKDTGEVRTTCGDGGQQYNKPKHR